MLAVSFLNPRQIRRLAIVVFAVSLIMVAATPYFGAEIKGARRWLVIFGVNIQPSEFLKPAFVILIAWLFGESAKRAGHAGQRASRSTLLLLVVALLVMQPDFGQTMLVVLVWSALFFMAGMRLIWVFGIAGIAGVGLTGAYYTVPHVARRIQHFLNPASGDTFNIDIATESFMRGGWFGRGPGEGTVKRILPESHTDFVFAVAAEEFGVALCLVLVALFAFIVIRALVRAMRNEDSVHALCRRRAGHAVRHAVGDQCGGQSASHSGQGHDAAVHLLWRLLDALARLCHGHAAGADPRAAARGDADRAGACERGERSLDLFRHGRARRAVRARNPVHPCVDARHKAGLTAVRQWRCKTRTNSSCSRPAAPAGICFRPKRWPTCCKSAAPSVELATDVRAAHFKFPARAVHLIPSATLRGRNPLALARTAALLTLGIAKAWSLIGRIRPAVVVGFGGYPTVPPLMAASLRGMPTVLHEQNGVMGRANRSAGAARHRDRHRLSHAGKARSDAVQSKITFTGNPVRRR